MVDALNYMVQSSEAQKQLPKMVMKFGDVQCSVAFWFAVQDAYDKLNAEGAFEIGGKLFGMHDEEQAEYFICYDERVCDQCLVDHVDPEASMEQNQNQVCQIIKLLKQGTRVDF